MRERLEQIGRELVGSNDEPVWVSQLPTTNLIVEGLSPEESSASTRRKIERVLVIDDQADQFLNAEAYLDELGIEDIDFCEDFNQGVRMAKRGDV